MADRTPGGATDAERRPARRFAERFLNAQRAEARRILTEILQARGLLPLLMKVRNDGGWTADEKRELLRQLRRLIRLSPYLLLLLLPGSALLLPLYAWWLDRRRQRRTTPAELPPAG